MGEAERPYDVTGWTLPLQMGIEAPAITAIQEPPGERRASLIREENEVRKDLALTVRANDESPIPNPIKRAARIGIYRSSIGNMDEGWTRFVFDSFNLPYKSLLDSEMRSGALSSGYDVIILPSQRARDIVDGNAPGTYPPELTGGIAGAGTEGLKQFVTDGGTLICFDASCEFVIKQFQLPLRNVLENLKSSDFYCPGSILSLEVDSTQPLARTVGPETNAYFINSSAFETTDPRVKVVARYAKQNVLRSGWLLGEDQIRGRIALAEVRVGKGRVVLFGFRPQHRGQTWATFPFIWNAISLQANEP